MKYVFICEKYFKYKYVAHLFLINFQLFYNFLNIN